MLPLAITISAAALVFLALAIRGHTIARGRFCRRCRFDLAGLDPTATPACPECGRSLDTARSIRPTLRRTSRPALVIAVVLLLTGVGLTSAGIANNGPRVMAALPDAAVLLLHRAGLDAALTETATRSARTPPIRAAAWPRLIEQSLALQADRTKLWDIRHGEILANAYEADRMTEPQIARYLSDGYSARLIVRDDALHGRAIPIEIEYAADRLTASPLLAAIWPGQSDARHGVLHLIRISGLTEPAALDPTEDRRRSWMTAQKHPNDRWLSHIRIRNEIGQNAPWDRIRPGDDVGVFVEIESELIEHGQNGVRTPMPTVRFDRTVRVRSPDAPIVALIEDARLAVRVRAVFGVGPLRILDPGDDQTPDRPTLLGAIVLKAGDRPRDIAGTVFVRSGGAEIALGRVVIGSTSIDPAGFGRVNWMVSADELGKAREAMEAWTRAGRVDVVFRTDPDAAYSDPRIGSVLRVDMEFADVPVQVVGSKPELSGPDGGIRVPAVLTTEP